MVTVRSGSGPARLIFFGTPAFAVPSIRALVDSPHRVVAVVTQPDRPRGRGHAVSPSPVKALALDHDIPVLQPHNLRDASVAAQLADYTADLGIVAAYGKILPSSVLESTRIGLVNVHASLLPKYRGAAPIHRAVIAGEVETGVTIMRVVQALDAGPMLAQARQPIGPDETSDSVERALADLGAALLADTIGAVLTGTQPETAQDDAEATYAPRITRQDGVIDWNRSPKEIHDLVRGLHPWPHAFTYLGHARLLVHRTTVLPGSSSAAPGTILKASDGQLVVATRAGSIDVTVLQIEGRRPMAARDFLAGHRLPVGSTFRPTPSP